MAVFRVEKTRDYTVMSNHHLRNVELSLKAKGLLSLMLSLPENWDYTTKGLAKICKDGVDSICAGVQELEKNGYIIRERIRRDDGTLGGVEYTILEEPRFYEQPERENPVQVQPKREKPVLEKPRQGKPEQENPAQLNTKESNTKGIKYLSNRIVSGQDEELIRLDATRSLIETNLEYEYLLQTPGIDKSRLDEVVDLIVETLCLKKKMIRISGEDKPVEVVKAQFMKLNSSHVQYVLERLCENETHVRNIKQYLLAALFNAPVTINNYYAAKVQHDTYGEPYEDYEY